MDLSRSRARPLGDAALTGWRSRVADTAATPIAARTPLDASTVRQAIGVGFFLLSLLYVVKALDRWWR